jgi:putative phage-type endonuclease
MALLTTSQRTPDWQAARVGRLTASNFAAAVGVSPFLSRQALWREYIGIAPPFGGNAATAWGERNEDVARHAYEKLTGDRVETTGFFAHEAYGWMGCSPDGLVGGDGGVEIKCPYWAATPHLDVPGHYMAQVQGCLEILDRAWWDFVSWTPRDMRIIRVFRCRPYWDWMLPHLEAFWTCVRDEVEPSRLRRRPHFGGAVECRPLHLRGGGVA